MTQRILCIWFPNWPIQCALLAEPGLEDRALVLESRDARRGLVVAAASLQAKKAGARIGMRMSELASLIYQQNDNASSSAAQASGTSHPVWEVRPYRPDEYLDVLCDLCDSAHQFSPVVGLESIDPVRWAGRDHSEPECLLADVGGTAHLFGSEQGLLSEIAAWLERQGLFAYLAISSTIGAAWAMSNYELRRTSRRSASLSKTNHAPKAAAPSDEAATVDSQVETSSPFPGIPSKRPTCRGIVTEMWEEEELLAELPLAALRLDEATIDKLTRLGIRRPLQLWQLPRDGLATRLGSQLMLRSDQALGNAKELIAGLHSSPEWHVEQDLEFPTSNRETLRTIFESLCKELCVRLEKQGRGALRVRCRLDIVRKPPLLLNLGLYAASHDCDHLLSLVDGQLDALLRSEEGRAALATAKTKARRVADPRKTDSDLADAETVVMQHGVWRVVLEAVQVGPVVWQQSELFDDAAREHRREVGRLIDKLSSRLGRDNVLEARIERNAEPESAVSFRPLTGRRRDGRDESTLKKLTSRLARGGVEPVPTDPLRRPTRLNIRPRCCMASQRARKQAHPMRSFGMMGTTESYDSGGPRGLRAAGGKGPVCAASTSVWNAQEASGFGYSTT